MQSEIVRKLNAEMALDIESERQVVYILAEIRKLIELAKFAKHEWLSVRFVCDWVLHTNLERNGWAKELLAHVDAVVASGQSLNSLKEEQERFLQENFTLEAARVSLMTLLRDQKVRPRVFGDVYQWKKFMKHFSGVVADCPLILTGGKFVKQVQLQIIAVDDKRYELVWKFLRTDGVPFEWVAPVEFEEPDGFFGRSGRRTPAQA
jgi:hypothetical protein